MLPKKHRADKKSVEEIFKNGKFINSTNLSFKFVLNKNLKLQKISFIVPKSTAKTAVKRNLLRRRGYAVLKKYLNDFPVGLSGAFVLKKDVDSLELSKQVEFILNKL
ncbi:ribonuclease P protein component [Candidatus Nomurabacteria bacterium]|nr:ribonuclease P protein component [Candidatus Nomurabacteria bacterium]